MADDQDRALLDDLLARARRAGADGADAVYIRAQSQSVSERLGAPEAVERSEELTWACGSSWASARPAWPPPISARHPRHGLRTGRGHGPRGAGRSFARLATAAEICQEPATLEMFDADEPTAESLRARARARRPPAPSTALPIPKAPRPAGASMTSRSPPPMAFSAAIAVPATASAPRSWPVTARKWSAITITIAKCSWKTSPMAPPSAGRRASERSRGSAHAARKPANSRWSSTNG